MQVVEKIFSNKDTFYNLNEEITASTIIALEKVCSSIELNNNNDKENK